MELHLHSYLYLLTLTFALINGNDPDISDRQIEPCTSVRNTWLSCAVCLHVTVGQADSEYGQVENPDSAVIDVKLQADREGLEQRRHSTRRRGVGRDLVWEGEQEEEELVEVKEEEEGSDRSGA